MARIRPAVALLLSVAGGVLTLVLLSKHYGVPLLGEAVLAACGVGEGCDIVSQSRYAVFLSLPLAAWGLMFYASVAALVAPALAGKSESEPHPGLSFAFVLSATAVLIDVLLLGLQIFAIQAFCKFCIATYVVNLLLVLSLWPHRQLSRASLFLFAPEARGALTGWVFASLWAFAAAVATNAALESRKELAGNSILGAPSPLLQAPKKPEAGSIEEQLQQAQAEARKWKNTLDDERLLQIYLNQKARDDFNKAEVSKLDLSRAPAQGPKSALITVVTFSDFMCPFCRDLANGLKNFLPATSNQIQTRYKYFPLDKTCNTRLGQTLHPGACELALGGICADEGGRFWEYHDKVFSERWDKATREDALRIGASVGLDRGKLSACMDAAATRGLLAKDIDEGDRVSVASTPTIFVNGRKLQSTSVFLLAIEEERKRLNLPLTEAPAPQKP
jgi:protein-disulfide isomerase/uncharacterized membrane protein